MATFIPNLRTRAPQAPANQAFVDTPNFIYADWLNNSGGIDGAIGKLAGQTVGIVGAGPAGCVAAFELQKCGARVTLFDAETEAEQADMRLPGGRLYSSQFRDSNGRVTADIAELGAMRFPPSEETLFYYLDHFKIATSANFPDPGKVPTWVYYKGRGQIWSNASTPPNGFETVWNGWSALVHNGIYDKNGQVAYWSSATFNHVLQSSPYNGGMLNAVTSAWQSYLDEFGNDSFYSGLARIFGPQAQWRIPGNAVWTAEDFTRFGALGIGSGGFGPLYNIGFNYIYRLLTNALETDQRFVPGGISQLCTSFIDRLRANGGFYKPDTRVARVEVMPDTAGVTLALDDGTTHGFDRVIVATTTRAMEMGLNLSDAQIGKAPNKQTTHVEVGEAIDRVHVVSSTKLFLRTRKFWTNPRFPRNILSDTKLPQLYTLDYDEPDSGVVLVTYTWEDDSTKAQALDGPELLELLKDEIRTITRDTGFDDYADQLVPYTGSLDRDMRYIVWQDTKDYFGAFALARPGQDSYIDTIFHDFAKAGTAQDNLVYVAGDCTSWVGGWADGALHTGLNCAAGVIQSLGGAFTTNLTPMNAVAPKRYSYYPR